MSKAKPVYVLISDIHFNQNTLELASDALRQALLKAGSLKVPLVIAGDLNDTKSIIRGECLNRLIEILSSTTVDVWVIVGNHDMINEKSKQHTLNFLSYLSNVNVVDKPTYAGFALLVPYQTNTDDLKAILEEHKAETTIIMHQGVRGAYMGEYTVDKSSIEPEALKDFRVISGHYHRAQDIKCGPPRKGAVGLFSYIGTPYSITFAEANDGPKGFRILREDGTLESVPTNLRKHVKVTRSYKDAHKPIEDLKTNDLLWLQIKGPASELDKLSKKEIGLKLLGHQNFKLDKLYDHVEVMSEQEAKSFTDEQILDKIIEGSEETKEAQKYLKALWREILQ